jgi:hypothetical protein
MKKTRYITFTIISLSLWLIFSGWGSVGHHTISQHAPASFPSELDFLQSTWSVVLLDNCMVPDERKQWDYSESAKHYIDIDNYSGFNLYGKIPMSRDSASNIYGYSFVLNNGIIPWATIATFDSISTKHPSLQPTWVIMLEMVIIHFTLHGITTDSIQARTASIPDTRPIWWAIIQVNLFMTMTRHN